MSSVASSPLLKLHPEDNIAIARNSVAENQVCPISESQSVTAREDIDLGHKVAIQQIAKGSPIRKFGQVIGFATCDMQPGDWIHSHNLEAGELSLDYAYSSDVPAPPKPIEGRTFMGYR
ncbi:UxaA family hydrolase, partial [uncultured Gimesia sp.]|uniref:UxaA family hydrolase n=1 Tax=uncultured Gimesia sp. TaxID=1678688 RepID=UPI00262AF454